MTLPVQVRNPIRQTAPNAMVDTEPLTDACKLVSNVHFLHVPVPHQNVCRLICQHKNLVRTTLFHTVSSTNQLLWMAWANCWLWNTASSLETTPRPGLGAAFKYDHQAGKNFSRSDYNYCKNGTNPCVRSNRSNVTFTRPGFMLAKGEETVYNMLKHALSKLSRCQISSSAQPRKKCLRKIM